MDHVIFTDVSDRRCPKCGSTVGWNREGIFVRCDENGHRADSQDWGKAAEDATA